MILRRYFSGAVREAVAMLKHVQRLMDAQRDVLKPQAIAAVEEKIGELTSAIKRGDNDGAIRNKTEELQFAGEKWLKPYPNAVWRENVEVLLVAIAVAMAIRTFFLQPFKIPTGSMQPTLYGITSTPDFSLVTSLRRSDGFNYLSDPDKAQLEKDAEAQIKAERDIVIPGGWERFKQWIHGYSYIHWVAPEDGTVDAVQAPWPGAIFNLYQRIEFAGQWHTILFPPDCGEAPLDLRAGLRMNPGRVFHKGDDVIKLRIQAGDHLFVDRLTYNFRPPKRGEIVVFQTAGIETLSADQQNTFYIKRLVGLGGDHLTLKQDYSVTNLPLYMEFSLGQNAIPVGHLVVNGEPITTNNPHFANLYSFSNPPRGATMLDYVENTYLGHAMIRSLAPDGEVDVEPRHLFVMGDNTFNSSDSRFWGDFPATNVIGKSFFVYWPISKRWGLDGQ
jgi:signal peptidase I